MSVARRMLVHGTLWGTLTSALEWLNVGLHEAPSADALRVLLYILPGWCIVGVGLAGWIEIAGTRLQRPPFFAASVVGCALVLSGVWSSIYALGELATGHAAMAVLFPNGLSPVASYLYQTWVIVFYGGLYFYVWALNHRAERTRGLLSQAQVARLQAETLLGESQLAALRDHVEPQFLLQALAEAERRYARDYVSADRLIAHLVALLRLAMPGVRTGRSSLRPELELAEAYAVLAADIGASNGAWSTAAAAGLPDIPLPPLLVVGMLESVASARAARLYAAVDGARVVLRVEGALRRQWMESDRAYRLRVALSTMYGDDWSLEPASVRAGLVLSLPVRMREHRSRETIDA